MMTQQLPASILTAPLAQIDRRALSQAWYSALHLAHASVAPAIPSLPSEVSEVPVSRSDATGLHRPPRERAARPVVTRAVAVLKPASSAEPISQMQTRSRLARQIERAFQDARKPVVRSTLTLGRREGRAYLILQSNGDRLRLFALCRLADRRRVACALEEARYALAVRGYALETCVRVASCS